MDIEHTLPGLHNSSNDAKAEFNNCLLFIQNNSYFTNKLKHAYLHRSTSIACLSAGLGAKGFFRTANILQIADVVRRVVFLLVLLCFQPVVRPFLPLETSEMFRHFVLTTTQPRLQVFSVNGLVFWQLCCTTDVIVHISQNSSKFGRHQLVMMNYPWDFSQSETEKYFEWIIMYVIYPRQVLALFRNILQGWVAQRRVKITQGQCKI